MTSALTALLQGSVFVLADYSRAFTSRAHVLTREPAEALPQLVAAMAETLSDSHPARQVVDANTKALEVTAWLRQENWLQRNCTTALCRLLDQHRAAVLALAYSPNGEKVASGDADGTVLVWYVESGVVDCAVNAEAGPICAVSFSPDGTRLYCACSTRGVLVLDIRKRVFTIVLKRSGVSSLALSSDGLLLLVADSAGHLVWVNTASMKTEHAVGNSLTGAIHCLAPFPAGRHFASGGEDGAVRLWDGRTGTPSRICGRHSDRVVSVAVSPDGTRVASGSRDRSVVLWDVGSGRSVGSLVGHRSIVSALSFVSAGARLISGSYDRTIRLWDASSGLLLGVVAGHEGWVRSLAVSPAGDRVTSGSEDGMVKVWNESLYDGTHAQHGHSHWILRTCVSKNERRLISVSRDSTICIWDLRDESIPPMVLQGHKGWVHAVVAMQGDTGICTSGNDMTVRAWDVCQPQQPRTLFRHTAMVRAAAAGAGWIAVGGVGSLVSVWRAEFRHPRRLELFSPRITDMAATPEGQRLLVRCSDRSVRLIDPAALCELRRFLVGPVTTDCEMDRRYSQSVVGCSSDGSMIYAGSAEGRISVWDAALGKLVFEQEAHRGGVRAACILPCGPYIATGGEGYAVRVWNLTSGTLVTTFHATAPPSLLTWLYSSNQLCMVESSVPRPRVRLFSLCGAK